VAGRFSRSLIGAACLSALLVGACGGTGAAPSHVPRGGRPHPVFGAFAGYNWFGSVRSVGASWRVPRIERDSSPGRAGTWIGAEAPGLGRSAPFIQVGTSQELHAGDHAFYFAFWRDTVRHFHPAVLFRAKPGDQISASLVNAGNRWAVSIRDITSGRLRTVRTLEEGRAAFNMAGWIDEDITSARTNRPIPYPRLSRIRFTAMRVDGRPPAGAALRSTWMSEHGTYLGPSALRDAGGSRSSGRG
jgi:hypothetical protein